jgi:hypothetical protein
MHFVIVIGCLIAYCNTEIFRFLHFYKLIILFFKIVFHMKLFDYIIFSKFIIYFFAIDVVFIFIGQTDLTVFYRDFA